MALSDADLITLGNHIRANTDPVVVQALADGNNNGLRDLYNANVSPDYWIYRAIVPADEVRNAIDLQNLADITATDLERSQAMLRVRETTGYSGETESDRSAWDDVFSAAAGDESQQAIAALWQRPATVAETAFALSTGSGADSANPDTTSWQGTVSTQDIRDVLNLTAP